MIGDKAAGLFFAVLALSRVSENAAANKPICVGSCNKPCSCTENFTFQCGDGTCIPLTSFKNSVINCPDGSDECVNACPGTFKCDTVGKIGKCLPARLIDDGVIDCVDQSDETSAIEKMCDTLKKRAKEENQAESDYMYVCDKAPGGAKTGLCIFSSWLLDGKVDCPMADDEDEVKQDACKLKKKCSPQATCTKTAGKGHTCVCQSGYTGDGVTCTSTSSSVDRTQKDPGSG